MKLIIAGGRNVYADYETISQLVHSFGLFHKIKEVVSGTAEGVDKAGETYRETRNVKYHNVPTSLKQFPPNRELHGTNAFKIRNSAMAAYSDALLLIWDGQSTGSADIKAKMLELKKPIYEVVLKRYNTSNE